MKPIDDLKLEEIDKLKIKSPITVCINEINKNKIWARNHLFVVGLTIGFMVIFLYIQQNKDTINLVVYYSTNIITVLIFGVFISLHRYHLKEVAKYNQMLMGFWRTQIAIELTEKDILLRWEVTHSLGDNAFTNTQNVHKSKKIESPVPGHLGSDSLALLINKISELIGTINKLQTK